MAEREAKTEVLSPESVTAVRMGKEIILPVGMSYDDGILWLERRRDEEDQEVHSRRTFKFFPSEGAIALKQVMEDRYGWVKSEVIPMMFGSQKPELLDVEVGIGQVEQVPYGRFAIPNVTGFVQCGYDFQGGLPCFTLHALTQQKYAAEIEELFEDVGRVGLRDTPYRGAAIRLPHIEDDDDAQMIDYVPKFIDVRSAAMEQMVFSRDLEELLMDNLFGPVMHTEAFRSAAIPLKMGVLLEGDYGCGKTLVANLLAKVCTQHQWTYVLCEDPLDLARCVKVARRFEPCVVFCEDIDRNLSGKRRDKAIDQILNTIDGIEAKGTEIVVVLTTNHVEQLTPAMRRPGRLDVVVPIGPPDAEAVGRMIALYAGGQVAADADLTEVNELLDGRTPAVIREVVERAKRTAIVMEKPERLTGAALARAARGMRRHLDLLDNAPVEEVHPVDNLANAIRSHGSE